MHGRSRMTIAIRPSHPYNAGTEHVGFSTTRQTLLTKRGAGGSKQTPSDTCIFPKTIIFVVCAPLAFIGRKKTGTETPPKRCACFLERFLGKNPRGDSTQGVYYLACFIRVRTIIKSFLLENFALSSAACSAPCLAESWTFRYRFGLTMPPLSSADSITPGPEFRLRIVCPGERGSCSAKFPSPPVAADAADEGEASATGGVCDGAGQRNSLGWGDQWRGGLLNTMEDGDCASCIVLEAAEEQERGDMGCWGLPGVPGANLRE